MLEPIKTLCKYCRYYEPIKGKHHGYCRRPYSHYEGLKVNGAKKGADRCFEKRGADNG